MTRSRPLRAAPRQRGTAYLVVLATTMLVTLLGVSGLTALRLERATRQAGSESDAAAILADSAIDLALQLTLDEDWRDDYTSGRWSSPITLGRGTIRYRFVDEVDGDLDDDESDAVTVEGEGVFGAADDPRSRRRACVRLDPSLHRDTGSADVVRQGGMNSTSHWSWNGVGAASVARQSEPGNDYLRIKDRSVAGAGAVQELTGQLTEPGEYDLTLRARGATVGDTVRVKVYLRTNANAQHTFTLAQGFGTTWTSVNGSMNLAWSGTVAYAVLELVTTGGTGEFHIDNVSLTRRTKGPAPVVPGSWRRVVLSSAGGD